MNSEIKTLIVASISIITIVSIGFIGIVFLNPQQHSEPVNDLGIVFEYQEKESGTLLSTYNYNGHEITIKKITVEDNDGNIIIEKSYNQVMPPRAPWMYMVFAFHFVVLGSFGILLSHFGISWLTSRIYAWRAKR